MKRYLGILLLAALTAFSGTASAARIYLNNVSTKLTAAVAPSDLTLNVTAGDGAQFAAATGSDWIIATVVKVSGFKEIAQEIVKITARSTDALTVVRAQEGTSALSFAVGDKIEVRATAASFISIPAGVADGGTGRATSTTAYGLIAAGTTATGAHQTLAAGATTEILVGGGASALPVWTTATGTGAPVRADSATVTGTWVLPSTTSIGTVSSTELGYVDGVTSAIQTQLDAKAAVTATRVKLTAARTYYVRTDGNDSNTCLADTAGGACLTIQAAVNLAAAIDNGGYDVTIQVRDGTYAEDVSLKTIVGSGSLIVQGNSVTPANVITKTWSASYVIGNFTIKDLVMTNGSVAARLSVGGRGCVVSFSNVTFGGVTSTQHIGASDGGVAKATGNYTISASTSRHAYSATGGSVEIRSKTVTLSGTPAWTTGFAHLEILGQMLLDGNTFSGAATGPRYNASLNSVIYTAGGGATYLPGNSAGSTATGGQYN